MSLTHLNPQQRATWTTTFSDLKALTLVGIALLRGTACPIEETAMAKMCNPNKTKHLTKEQRGFLAFESTLDRASTLFKLADPKGIAVANDKAKVDQEIPRDALIDAQSYDAVKGETGLVNAYMILTNARSIFIRVKEKYGDALKHKGTKTLDGKAKRVSKAAEVNVMAELRKRFAGDVTALGAELVKYSENPAAYVLPAIETAQDETEAVAEQAKSMAEQAKSMAAQA